MQSDSAVVSITRRPRSIASRCVSSGRNSASGSRRGSSSYTPSTSFLPMRIASAPISSARRAAAVSVVKNGLPVPAAKITTRSFSRCRIAQRAALRGEEALPEHPLDDLVAGLLGLRLPLVGVAVDLALGRDRVLRRLVAREPLRRLRCDVHRHAAGGVAVLAAVAE